MNLFKRHGIYDVTEDYKTIMDELASDLQVSVGSVWIQQTEEGDRVYTIVDGRDVMRGYMENYLVYGRIGLWTY